MLCCVVLFVFVNGFVDWTKAETVAKQFYFFSFSVNFTRHTDKAIIRNYLIFAYIMLFTVQEKLFTERERERKSTQHRPTFTPNVTVYTSRSGQFNFEVNERNETIKLNNEYWYRRQKHFQSKLIQSKLLQKFIRFELFVSSFYWRRNVVRCKAKHSSL